MKRKFRITFGETQYPKNRFSVEGNQIKGPFWDAWVDDAKYYLEFEAAKHGGGGIKIEISKEAYENLKNENTNIDEIIGKFYKP